MGKLFIANLKMMVRNRQALFWMLMFPLMFTVIFGFFFGQNNNQPQTVAVVQQSKTEIAQQLVNSLKDSGNFTIQTEDTLSAIKEKIQKGKASSGLVIPEGFGENTSTANNTVLLVSDPANSQLNAVLAGYVNTYLTQVNYQVQQAKPIFTASEEKISSKPSGYFDFVLAGLIGMALMNASIQGVSISMSKYREDKILKRMVVTPVRSWKFVVADVLSRLVLNVVQISLILALGIYGFNAHFNGNFVVIYALALLGAILFQLIGFAIAAVSKTTQAAEGMATAVTVPMMFLAGVFFPIDLLPKWLGSIVQFLPLAPLLRMIRTTAIEAVSPLADPKNILIVIVWVIVLGIFVISRFRLSEE